MSELSPKEAADLLHEWINKDEIKILNVAGKSASKDQDIYTKTFIAISNLITLIVLN